MRVAYRVQAILHAPPVPPAGDHPLQARIPLPDVFAQSMPLPERKPRGSLPDRSCARSFRSALHPTRGAAQGRPVQKRSPEARSESQPAFFPTSHNDRSNSPQQRGNYTPPGRKAETPSVAPKIAPSSSDLPTGGGFQ